MHPRCCPLLPFPPCGQCSSRHPPASPPCLVRGPPLVMCHPIPDRLRVHPRCDTLPLPTCHATTMSASPPQLIKAYTSFDPRVRQLCLVVKRWAKRRCIADPYRGSPSSYAWVLLVINYLQVGDCRVALVRQRLARHRFSYQRAQRAHASQPLV